MNINKSINYFEEAKKYIPGGVNSPARAFKSVGGNPIFFDKAEGSILYDVDGNEYIDFVGSWGPMILGHSYPKVVEAIKSASEKATSFGAPTELEIDLAKLVCEMVPSLDKVRMVNSGTEATMSAIRLARAFTGKEKIIKFNGHYHGHGDSFLVKAGSGALTLGIAGSPGVTSGVVKDTLVAEYNDIESVEKLVVENKNEIACVILEPVTGNMGVVLPQNDFLCKLRDLCDAHNILLIFDEVMTGFRLAPGGAQAVYNIKPDLSTFGKIAGAGMPVGMFGGRDDIISQLAPLGNVYQAGTLSGNPLAMAAGLALLTELKNNPSIYTQLEEKTKYLELGLRGVLDDKGIDYKINRLGSMISIFFTKEEVTDLNTANTTNQNSFKKLFHGLLERGVYLPPSAFESWFLANSLDYKHLDKTIEAVKEICF